MLTLTPPSVATVLAMIAIIECVASTYRISFRNTMNEWSWAGLGLSWLSGLYLGMQSLATIILSVLCMLLISTAASKHRSVRRTDEVLLAMAMNTCAWGIYWAQPLLAPQPHEALLRVDVHWMFGMLVKISAIGVVIAYLHLFDKQRGTLKREHRDTI